MDHGDHYRTFGGWWLVWTSYLRDRTLDRWSGYPIVDEWFFAERTAVDELKHWHNYIASHAISENNPEKSECQKGLSRFGKT